MRNVTGPLLDALGRFRRDEDGLTAIENALVGGLVAMAVITVLLLLGEDITAWFAPPPPEA